MFKKIAFLLLCLGIGLFSTAQEDYFQQQKKLNKYEKKKNYKGPTDWYSESPLSIRDEEETYVIPPTTNKQNGIQYNPNTITRYRRDHNQLKRGQSGQQQAVEDEPENEKALIKPRSTNINPPRIRSSGNFLGSFWKVLAVIIIVALVLVILYFLLRNVKPVDRKIVRNLEDDWNPEIITKSELELKLDEAEASRNYRECIRIYFTFILKDLIKHQLIDWKKDKTNFQYVIELQGNKYHHEFSTCVNVYDLIWYGEYTIDKSIYDTVKRPLISLYQKIEVKDE